ncbi:MAG: CRISPR-associated endonuclease Cas2 [Magnetovibrio sp.]|nr:CRISPR-associated endonuclease Cas2 [Magnetovibrio sp.]
MLHDRESWLSGYDILWMLVMFDLPVVEKSDRKAATQFRNFLLDQGFAMAQFSVYYRMVSGKDRGQSMEQKIQRNLPEYGSVQIVSVTDKQYENIKLFKGKKRDSHEKHSQLLLF